MNKNYDVLIIGCGPCGIGAALKLKEAGFSSLAIIERSTPGGKVNIAPRVDNYPGFKEVPGPDLAYAFFERINQSGIEIIGEDVISLTKNDNIFTLKCEQNTYTAKAVLIATGTKEKQLGFPNEDALLGHGISYCALCDGHFFKGADIAVVGGGNSALKESLYLSNIVNHLYLIHRRVEFRGKDQLLDELKAKPNVTILTPFIPLEILASDRVIGLKIQNRETEEITTLSIDGIFPLIGQIPNTQFIKIEGVLDENGNVPVDKNMMTIIPGLFAGGDVLPRPIRQIYLAEHDGMVAAKSIASYLKEV